jgi:predicted metal-dependent peptidase
MEVNFSKKGFNLYYNKEFIDGLKKEELLTITIHEVFHILHYHGKSRIGTRDWQLANVATDMIINTLIRETYPNLIWPKNGEKEAAFFVPKEYKEKLIFEKLYDWLKQMKEESEKPEENQSEEYKNLSNETKDTLKNMKTFDVHLEDEVSSELREQISKDLVNMAKSRGTMTEDLENALNRLNKSKKNYLRLIKKSISYVLGNNKCFTWSKPNRKELDLKGFKKYKNKLNFILDTSGSMNGDFEKALGYIFYNGYELNLIQADTEVKDEKIIKNKNELKKIKIKGLGGTTLQPAIDLISKKYNNYATILFTDGYTDTLDFSKIKNRTFILTTEIECPILGGNNKVKQICIKKE